MSVSRDRLQAIINETEEAAAGWSRCKRSKLASWVLELAGMVAALDEESEQHEAEIVALGDAVDQIDARIDGIVGEVPDVIDDFEDTIDLTAAPYVLDLELEDNFARFENGKLHVGARFHHALLAAKAHHD